MLKTSSLTRILSVVVLSLIMIVLLAATIQAQSDGDASDPVDAPRSHVGEGIMDFKNNFDASEMSCPGTMTVTNSFTGNTTQLGRIFRDAIPSVCPAKVYPGIFNNVITYNYEVHTFSNPGLADSCVVVNFDPNSGSVPCGTNAHASGYLNSYDPNNQANNYVGDVGSSITQPFSFTVPAGELFLVQVSNTSGQAICDYSFSITQVACQNFTDLTIGKSGPSLVSVGQSTLYTITAANTELGGLDATNVVVNDLLPAGLTFLNASVSTGSYSSVTGDWSIPLVSLGVTEVLTIEAQASVVGIITNTAKFNTANEPDIDNTNDSASVETTIEMLYIYLPFITRQ